MKRRTFLTALPATIVATSHANQSAPKLRVAIIGHTGRGDYGHGLDTMWQQIPETEIVAVADADQKGLATEQKKLNLDRGFSDYRAMLSAVKPDIVAVATRHVDQHRDMILASIEMGVRGIYVEKPFCRTLQEADEIILACDKSGTKVAVAHRNRLHPVLPIVSKMIDEGVIGKVLEMRGRGKEDPRGGSLDLWVLGSHIFNLACYFGGNAIACSAEVKQEGRLLTKADVMQGSEGIGLLAGNEVHARYELAKGMPLYFDSIQNAGVKEAGFGLQIIGTKGVLDFRIDREPLVHLRKGNPFQPTSDPQRWSPITTGGIDQPEPIQNLGKRISSHAAAAYDLIAAIHENRAPLCDAEQGRQTLEMISAVFESHRHGGKRVQLPLSLRDNPLSLLD